MSEPTNQLPYAGVHPDALADLAAALAGAPGKLIPAGVLLDAVAALTVSPPQGRLTLTSGVPALIADVTAATSIYYTPYNGLRFPLYDGTRTLMRSFGGELALALSSNAAHVGYHQSGKNFDLFLIDDGGTIRLVSGPAWTNDTTRAVALAVRDGFLTNASVMTDARFGAASGNTVAVAANRGLYVGTFRASANGQTEMTFAPSPAAGGTNNKLFLWNAFNRLPVAATCRDSTNTWSYTTKTWRAANNSTNNRISYVCGLNEETIDARYSVVATNSSGLVLAYAGVGLNSTSAPSGLPGNATVRDNSDAEPNTSIGLYAGPSGGIGLQFVQALEASTASGATTWWGDNNDPSFTQMGLTLRMKM